MAVALLGGDADGSVSVAQRVRDKVGYDTFECAGVDGGLEVGLDLDRNLICSLARHNSDEPLETLAHSNALGCDLDHTRLEPGEIEQLLDHAHECSRVLGGTGAKAVTMAAPVGDVVETRRYVSSAP